MTKDDCVNILFGFTSNKYDKIDEMLHSLEAYISENEYDVQVELILHMFRTYKIAHTSNCFEDICEVAAPVFELLKTTDWGYIELYVLTTAIIYTPHHTISEDFKNEALDILDDDFCDHKDYDRLKSTLHLNLSMRHLRAKYHDGADPQDVKVLFDQCFDVALSIYEKRGRVTLRTILLLRKAIFDGDCNKILEYLDALEATGERALRQITQDDMIEFLHLLGDRITKPLQNFLIGHQIKKRRKELGMGTLDFADAIGSTQTVVNGFERGDKGIGGPRLHKIAKVLNVDMAYFYGDESKKYTGAVTDITTHKISQLVSELPEADKEYILELTRGYIKHKKKMLQPHID